jgi:hypothetical protein
MLAVVISEFVASNVTSLEDGYGSTPDWIEIYNSGSTEVDLNGYHLSDDPANPFAWRFDQSTTLGPQEYMVVFASGNNEVPPAGIILGSSIRPAMCFQNLVPTESLILLRLPTFPTESVLAV